MPIWLAIRQALLSRLTGDFDHDIEIVGRFFGELDINPRDRVEKMLTHISFLTGAMD